MSNFDINVDRRTDRRKIGCLYRILLQAGAIKSTITVAYYANLLDQLRTVIRDKRRGKLSKQDNARVHTCKIAMDAVERNGYELIPHPAYSPDLAPSDYFLFPNLKKDISGSHFRSTKKSWRQLRSGSETRTLASSVLG